MSKITCIAAGPGGSFVLESECPGHLKLDLNGGQLILWLGFRLQWFTVLPLEREHTFKCEGMSWPSDMGDALRQLAVADHAHLDITIPVSGGTVRIVYDLIPNSEPKLYNGQIEIRKQT